MAKNNLVFSKHYIPYESLRHVTRIELFLISATQRVTSLYHTQRSCNNACADLRVLMLTDNLSKIRVIQKV